MHEFAIRIALGAQSRDILKLGLGFGVALAATGPRDRNRSLICIHPIPVHASVRHRATDPMTFAGISALLFAAALLACYVPVRACTRANLKTFLQ